ncbi:LOW QUALITY PROTEIN: F-box only protein 41-like [Spinachia spinachia]
MEGKPWQRDRNMSSSSSSSSSSEPPYFCPRCGNEFRFSSVPELRAHLVSRHTYETLLLLSQARVRSSRPGGLLPLPGPAQAQRQRSSLGVPLATTSSAASIRLLGEMFGASAGPAAPFTALVEFGLSVGVGLEQRMGLGLHHKIARTFAEVEERGNHRVARLKEELGRREAELELERRGRERLKSEKRDVEEREAYLCRQVSAAMEMMQQLKNDLEGRDKELSEHQREMVDIECFLRATAKKEAEAKCRLQVIFCLLSRSFVLTVHLLRRLRDLQVFIETLLDRADRAERQLLLFSSQHDRYAPARGGRSPDGSANDVPAVKMQESFDNRRSYSVSGCDRLGEQPYDPRPYSGPTGRMRTWSLGSGGWDGEGGAGHPPTHLYAPPWTRREGDRLWGEEGGFGRTLSIKHRRHYSTEEEEEDDEEEDEEGFWNGAEMSRPISSRRNTPGCLLPAEALCSTPSRRHGDGRLGADSLRLRAGLFCVFPYLEARSLLRAAEVCGDWRFVARHPAVWTRLHLKNARVSAEFLTTLSQWCTQTQSLVLNNLKPRSRRANETREDYHKNTRGSVEPGVEALLRSAGGSLLHLSVSQCPHILTDRTLWLASCYSRSLQMLTYRSSSHPLGHEVLWALGAGCRSITSLQVAPSHPCQQPTRFGNRCLQTIGRCWPHLRSLSVGGAGCGTQGLAALVHACAHLQVLELQRVRDLDLQAAMELCAAGLKSLHTLTLTHTPVSVQALLHLHGACANISSMMVEVDVSDYFEEAESQEARRLFGEILDRLKVLQGRPGLCDVLQVKAGGLTHAHT